MSALWNSLLAVYSERLKKILSKYSQAGPSVNNNAKPKAQKQVPAIKSMRTTSNTKQSGAHLTNYTKGNTTTIPTVKRATALIIKAQINNLPEYLSKYNNQKNNFIGESLKCCREEKNTSEASVLSSPIHRCILTVKNLVAWLVLRGEKSRTLLAFEPWSITHGLLCIEAVLTAVNLPDVDSFFINDLQLSDVNAIVFCLHDNNGGAKSSHYNGYLGQIINHSHSIGNSESNDDDDDDGNDGGDDDDADDTYYKATNYDCICELEYRQPHIVNNITSFKSEKANNCLFQKKMCSNERQRLSGGGSEPMKRTTSAPVVAVKRKATVAAATATMYSAKHLAQNAILDAALTSSTRDDHSMVSSLPIKVLHKSKIITTKAIKSTAAYDLVWHVFLVAAFLSIVLTVNHVNGQQHLVSIAATTTSTMLPPRNKEIIKTTETKIQISETTTLEFSEIVTIKDRRTNSSERSVSPQRLAQNHQQRLDQQRAIVEMQVNVVASQWRALMNNFTSVNNQNKYQTTSNKASAADNVLTNKRDADRDRREVTQHDVKRFSQSPFILTSHSANRSRIPDIKLGRHLSQITVNMPKIEDAYKRDNSLIHYSQFIYDKSYVSTLFNDRLTTGNTTITAQMIARSVSAPTSMSVAPGRERLHNRRRSVHITNTHSQNSNGTDFSVTSNNNQQHYSAVRRDIPKVSNRLQRNTKRSSQNQYGDEDAVRDAFFANAYNEEDVITSLDVVDNATLTKIGDAFDSNSTEINYSFITDRVNMRTRSSQIAYNEGNEKLLKLVMDGLHLQKLPNMKKVNISQREYVTKYREYLLRVHERKRRELAELPYIIADLIEREMENAPLHIVTIAPNATEFDQYSRRKRNILNDLDEDDYVADADATTEHERVTGKVIVPRKQRNDDRKLRRRPKSKTTMVLRFALERNAAQLQPGDVEEANIRLMLVHSAALAVKSNKQNSKLRNRICGGNTTKNSKQQVRHGTKQKHVLNLKVYQRLGKGKRLWLDGRKIDVEVDPSRADDTHSQWLQFDVTKAVEAWLREQQTNLGLEVQCDNCQRVGARILNDMSSPTNVDDVDADDAQLMPVLNIIARMGVTYKEMRSNKHSNSAESIHYHHHNVATLSNGRKGTSAALDKHTCHKGNKRCCRHTMEVVFKEIKGFEFIIQPKVFDAGYCHGSCPPRYNPAHHHAMLQSLIWKQSRERAPRPCCAPSKLVELEVLHVDEEDSEKLKISTWTDMRVVECACS